MGENSAIEWTTHTFNPWMGCTKVSAGCKNCYAERDFDHRFKKVQWGPGRPRVRTSAAKWREPLQWNAEAAKLGIRPRVFSLSLGDWLDPEVPIEWLADFLALVQQTPHLDWLLVTKRPELFQQRIVDALIDQRDRLDVDRMLHLWSNGIPPKHVWLLASVENQEQADKRIPELLKIPAVVHGLSCEPLLGAVDITRFTACPICHGHSIGNECDCDPARPQKDYGVDWVICGGESGPNARPMHPDWARGLRNQCQAAEVPFFFKQWGEFAPWRHLSTGMTLRVALHAAKDHCDSGRWRWMDRDGCSDWAIGDGEREAMVRVGKKSAGRLLDGREWNELPEVAHG